MHSAKMTEHVLCFLCSFYAKLKGCVDNWAVASWCKGHGFLVDDIFLRVHQTYFSLCGYVHDPPFTVLLMLILPVVLAAVFIPFLCVRIVSLET